MPSSFKGLNLFGSGPHRFSVGKQGELALPGYIAGGSGAGSVLIGLVELDVMVVGRLVAGNESGLWSLRDAITAQLAHPPVPGTLIDTRGRVWSDMSLLTVQEGDRTDRGRVWSMAYKALFRRMD